MAHEGRFLPLADGVTLFARLALGAGFLSAVADRFGIWGPPGATNVAWGDFSSFSSYAARLNPWAPEALMPLVSWTATIAEIVLGLLLLAGVFTRGAAFASGVLLLLFAAGMTLGTGVKTALDASVFAASALGFLLSTAPRYPLSVDAALGRTAASRGSSSPAGSSPRASLKSAR